MYPNKTFPYIPDLVLVHTLINSKFENKNLKLYWYNVSFRESKEC